MATAAPAWRIQGDYFENCNCDVVCPCLFSTGAPMTATPTQGACEVPLAFHVERGRYGDVTLDGLNAVVAARTPGPMAEGNMQVAIYLDERADAAQQEALTAIFSGSAGGPMGGLAPLVGEVLGVRTAPIRYRIEGKRRVCQIDGVMQLAVRPVASIDPDAELVVENAHPFAMAGVAFAVGEEGSGWADYGMSWDNSGKNGHYAAIDWSG